MDKFLVTANPTSRHCQWLSLECGINCQTRELRTQLCKLPDAATIYHVDEIIVF
jgi:hypothetical protein